VREVRVSLAEIDLIAGTRAALGAGLGLLLAGRLADGHRRALGWVLLAVGLAATPPLLLDVWGRSRAASG
jgi:hypothetical protein